ncbi:uncharacterized protein PSFLO_06293 [Pseudozyma flocculosa]|uniref:Uncharacterized protein n=1 Tax=Pseudozyma flocculosa TaxID=84751 RepID=A0A5C3FBF7_9BASI|nr:uncharacterized protein PSFLO_06293 [Pseudozyma flocculosa]
MDEANSLKQSASRFDNLDPHNLDATARLYSSALAVSPPYSDLSLDEKLRKIGRPLKQGMAAAEGDAADLSGNSHPSPATPTHVPTLYPDGFDKAASRTAEEALVDHLSEAVLRANLDTDERPSAAAETANLAAAATESDPTTFKFTDLPVSVQNQGFYYRQRMAQIVLSCADEAKAAHFALMSRYYMKPFEQQAGPPPAPPVERANRIQEVAASTVSGDDCCGDDSDGADDSGAEFAWLENTGNKKKRKNARSTESAEMASAHAMSSLSSAAAAGLPAASAPPASTTNRSTLSGGAGEGLGLGQALLPSDASSRSAPYLPIASNDEYERGFERFPTAREADTYAPLRQMPYKLRIPYSSRAKALLRERLRAYFRRVRAQRARQREEEDEAARQAEAQELAEEAERQARLAAERKPQKRLTKAEKKAQARRGGAGGPKPMSIAAIKAARSDASQAQGLTQPAQGSEAPDGAASGNKQADAQAQAVESGPAGGQPGEGIKKADSEDEVELLLGSRAAHGLVSHVDAPRSSFDFNVRSPIADSLEALRASMSAVSLQINSSLGPLGPLDGTLADVMDKAAREGSADLARRNPSEPYKSLPASRSASSTIARAGTPSTAPRTSSTPTPNRGSAPSSATAAGATAVRQTPASASNPSPNVKARAQSTSHSHNAAGASAVAGTSISSGVGPTTQTATSPPLHSPPPKMTRRKKATMNNVHHRANYVPSRMPSDGPRNGGKAHGEKEQPPGLDHPSTTCGLFDGEWMCVFCEYELLYGEPPLMFRACRSRKKIVANRKRAQARARRAAEGGSTTATAGGSHHHHHHQSHHHNHPHTDHAHDSYETPRRKAGSGSGGTKSAHRSSRTSQSNARERCSCGNSIHESDEGSSAYTHSTPGSPLIEASRNGAHAGHYHDDGHHHDAYYQDSHHHNGYGHGHDDATHSPSSEHRHRQEAAPSGSGGVGGSVKSNGKAKAAPPAPAFDPNDYASVFAAMTKDKASQAAIARYIASGGKTTPPPVMLPSR